MNNTIKKQAVSFLIFTDSIRQAKTGKNRAIEGLKHYWVISLELTPSKLAHVPVCFR